MAQCHGFIFQSSLPQSGQIRMNFVSICFLHLCSSNYFSFRPEQKINIEKNKISSCYPLLACIDKRLQEGKANVV
jgi:hypothetical protein